MKTTVLFRIIVLVAMVLAGIANAEVKAQENNFITNEEKAGDLVVLKVVYKLDGSLYRHMKYDFTYDDQKRMSSKEAFKWNAASEKWIPYFKPILPTKLLWYMRAGTTFIKRMIHP